MQYVAGTQKNLNGKKWVEHKLPSKRSNDKKTGTNTLFCLSSFTNESRGLSIPQSTRQKLWNYSGCLPLDLNLVGVLDLGLDLTLFDPAVCFSAAEYGLCVGGLLVLCGRC